jgi:hypothetical protein
MNTKRPDINTFMQEYTHISWQETTNQNLKADILEIMTKKNSVS